MTDRLYYTDPYLREFDAVVTRVSTRGAQQLLILDRTAFYPTSGGQPFDVGTLGRAAVVDVMDEDDGSIAHVLSQGTGEDFAAGAHVHGMIEWSRRFDHMQQHTGQHVLSAAFDRLLHVRTVSFHMGDASSTIDLAREVTPAELAAAEEEANRVVWEDRPVAIRFATPAEAAALPLRKEPVREGTLRLIDVEGFDLSACGGTHVSRTGAIGIIAVASAERFKGGSRVEFVCGGRALRRFHVLRDAAAIAGRLLSVGPDELAASIERLQADGRDLRRATTALQSELARFRADELAASAEPLTRRAAAAPAPPLKFVARALDADASALKPLAAAVAVNAGFLVALMSTSQPAVVVIARSPDVSIAANALVAAVIARFGGKGGGRPELAQAGGVTALPADLFALVRTLV